MPTKAKAKRKRKTGSSWQRVTKVRRAGVYRAIGRAAREARIAGDSELARDLRTVLDLLRRQARVTRSRVS